METAVEVMPPMLPVLDGQPIWRVRSKPARRQALKRSGPGAPADDPHHESTGQQDAAGHGSHQDPLPET